MTSSERRLLVVIARVLLFQLRRGFSGVECSSGEIYDELNKAIDRCEWAAGDKE